MERVSKMYRDGRRNSKKILLVFVFVSAVLFSNSTSSYRSNESCIITTAKGEIGVSEEGGNNKGRRVSEYLSNANVYVPAAWCAAFVKWVLDKCGVDNTITAWSPSATSTNRIYDRRNPSGNKVSIEPGDVFTLYYPKLKRIGHTGFVETWGSKYVVTIEGNTNDAGDRDSKKGDKVMRRTRLVSTIYQVSRHR